MVRNEADIIEALVRHNLTVLDGLAIVDHGSGDGTSEILANLVAEGLPLTVVSSDVVAYSQSEITTKLVRDVFANTPADFVFVIDADEFLKIPSRPLVEDVLGHLPSGMHALLQWQTYVPQFAVGPDAPEMRLLLASSHRLIEERHNLHKVVVARHFMNAPEAYIEFGNHVVRPSKAHAIARLPNPHARIKPTAAALAHVPVRSADQVTGKIAVGWLAFLATHSDDPDAAFHWREAYHDIANGLTLSAQVLSTIACNYSIPKSGWLSPAEMPRVADPFLANIELKYAHLNRQRPLPLVLAFAERLIRGV
jgi:hypothetical protein